MKEATINFDGQNLTFKYEVWINIDFIYANVWDKHGDRHQFHFNDRGNFIRPISVKTWPDGLLSLIDGVLKSETPVRVLDKPGYYWERQG